MSIRRISAGFSTSIADVVAADCYRTRSSTNLDPWLTPDRSAWQLGRLVAHFADL